MNLNSISNIGENNVPAGTLRLLMGLVISLIIQKMLRT